MDISLYYTESGAGEPLILLHGNGEDSSYFSQQIPAFAEHFRVIAVDSRGHGQSPRGSAPMSIAQFAEDLADFMEEHAVPRAHVLGFSDGGNVALEFALRYPGKLNRLILNGANLNARGVKFRVQLPVEIGFRIARFFAKKSPEARKNAEILGLMVNSPNIPEEALSRIRAKTLVIAGKRDMIRDSHTRRIAERIPGAELCILPGDHFVAAGNPGAFNRAVLEFLQQE